MKLKEALMQWSERGDFDIIGDGGCWVAYCGTQLTDEGYVRYADVLELDCEFVEGAIPHLWVGTPTGEIDNKLEDMLLSMAGYCSVKFYEKHFID